jgi:preprotein translocase subunit SecF
LAAVLTIIGYSINDTIVVYDRVRENFRRVRKASATEIMNLSINQTLSRTIMTSGLTLLVVVTLFIFGGEMLRGFSLALIIGIVVGTYSSIYVAGSLAVAMGLDRRHLIVQPRAIDDHP